MPRSTKRKKKLPPLPSVKPKRSHAGNAWLVHARRGIGNALRYRPTPEDLRNLARSVAVLLGGFAATTLWMMFGPYALFPPDGLIDPWFYPGYFTNLSYLLSHNGITYYVSRLPWILPGLGAFAIASPPVASLLLCAAIVSVSAVSLYWAVRWHYGHAPAVLAAVALATNPYFMATASWHYPDGPAIAYAMVAIALYVRPRGPMKNSVLGAAFLALSGFTNMSGGPMILSVLLIPFWRNRGSLRGLLREALCAVAGVALATLILMKVSKGLLHDALFFMPQIKMFLFTSRTPSYLANMWGTGLGFLPTAFRLFLPLFLLAVGLALLIAVRRPAGPAWTMYVAAFACVLLYSFDQFVRHGVTLRVSYHSSYMLAPLFGLAGALLGELWKRGRGSRATEVILIAGALLLPVVWNRWHPVNIPPSHVWTGLAGIAVVAVGCAILTHWSQLPLRDASCSLLVFGVFLGPALEPGLQYVWAEPGILHGSNLSNGNHADVYRCLMDLQKDLKTSVDPNRKLEFWWDQDEPASNLYLSASAMYLEGFHDFRKELSTGSKDDIVQSLSAGTTFVHLTMHPERIPQRTQLLASRGIVLAPELRSTMQFGDKSFIVSLQDVTDVSRLH